LKRTGVCIVKILGLLWALPATWAGYAQAPLDCHYSVRGAIREQASVTPVLGATVFIPELGRGAVANTKGEYVITNLCAGDYTLICQHLGYHADTIRIHVHEGFVQCNFHLAEADIQLNAVVVAGERNPSLASHATSELKATDLERTRGLTLGEALKTLPGVSSIQTGPAISKPVIHGLHGNRILILNNGIRQEGQQWGAEHAPEIDPFIARRLTVVKGAGQRPVRRRRHWRRDRGGAGAPAHSRRYAGRGKPGWVHQRPGRHCLGPGRRRLPSLRRPGLAAARHCQAGR
jgi:iron complex outermembrane receptor protein